MWYYFGEQGVAQWRERWPPNNVALVQIPVSTPHVATIWESIFSNIEPVPALSSSAVPASNVVLYSKESLIPRRLLKATLNCVKEFSFRKGVS